MPSPDRRNGRKAWRRLPEGKQRERSEVAVFGAPELTFLLLIFEYLPVVGFLQLFNDALVDIVQGLWVAEELVSSLNPV